jgi:hypothetical protein
MKRTCEDMASFAGPANEYFHARILAAAGDGAQVRGVVTITDVHNWLTPPSIAGAMTFVRIGDLDALIRCARVPASAQRPSAKLVRPRPHVRERRGGYRRAVACKRLPNCHADENRTNRVGRNEVRPHQLQRKISRSHARWTKRYWEPTKRTLFEKFTCDVGPILKKRSIRRIA